MVTPVSYPGIYRTLLSAKRALVDAVPKFVLAIESNPTRSVYMDAAADYLGHLVRLEGMREWLDRVRWLYAGLHVSTALFGDYISLTCKPGELHADRNGEDYIQGRAEYTVFNFTRFLWPSQTVLRDKLSGPLELAIESSKDELITEEELSFVDNNVFFDANGLFALKTPSEGDHTVRAEHLRQKVIIPDHFKLEVHSGRLSPNSSSWSNHPHVIRALKQAFFSISHTHLHQLPRPYSIKPAEYYQAIANTLRLHDTANLIDPIGGGEPRTVIFFPVISGKTRLGVFCFVLGSSLHDEDRLVLQVLADSVITNLYLADQLIYHRKVEGVFRGALLSSPLLAHEGARVSHMAFNSVFAALQYLKASPPRQSKALDLLAEADNNYQILDQNIRQLKEALYEPNRQKSITSLPNIERELRRRILEKDVKHIEFQIPNSLSKLEIPAGDRLPSVLAEIVKNGLEAVERSENRDREIWVELGISLSENTTDAPDYSHELNIRIRDYGPGIPEDIMTAFNDHLMFTALSSSKGSTGKGMMATKYIEKICDGKVRYSCSNNGTTCSITIPCTVKEGSEP
jgi:signal transduction histidine kinase